MNDQPTNHGRGHSPAAPVEYLRRLLRRDPSDRQQARIVDLQRRFALRSGDSIFLVIAILEGYLAEIESACLDVQRSTRRIMRRASVLAATLSVIIVVASELLVPYARSALGWSSLQGAEPAMPSPLRAYVRADLDQMPEQDIARLAASRDAMAVLHYLPRLTDEELGRLSHYVQTRNDAQTH